MYSFKLALVSVCSHLVVFTRKKSTKQLKIWVFKNTSVFVAVLCLLSIQSYWGHLIRFDKTPPMILLATLHDGHKTSTCFPPCLSQSVFLAPGRPTFQACSNPSIQIVMQLAERLVQNCEIRWGRLDRLRSNYLRECAGCPLPTGRCQWQSTCRGETDQPPNKNQSNQPKDR